MVKEANVMSAELKKNVSFQFTLLSDTPFTPVPFSVATGTDVDIDAGEVKLMCALDAVEEGGRGRGPIVGIEVKDSKHGATNVWSLSKFKSVTAPRVHYIE